MASTSLVSEPNATAQTEALLQRITHAACCLMPASAAMVSLVFDDTEKVIASSGLSDHPGPTRALPFAVARWNNGSDTDQAAPFEPIVIPDVRRQADERVSAAMLEAGMVALVIVPLISGSGNRIGTIAVADSVPRRWGSTDIEAIGDLAALTAAAIDRSRDPSIGTLASHDDIAALARLRRSFDDGLAGHAVAAADGEILACNPEFARIAGLQSSDEAIGQNLHSLEPVPGAFHPLLERLQESSQIPLEEICFVRRDGTPSYVLARLSATRDGNGDVTEIRVYLVDITQRFRAEQKLRDSAERLALIELATQDVLWDWDLVKGTLTWNDAIARRFRYTRDEIRATTDWHFERIHPSDRERVLRGIERAVQGTENSWSDEYRFLRGDGTYAAVLDRAHLVRNPRGETIRVIGAILDISELRASEEAQRLLARASTALESALEIDATARTLARISLPALADAALVDLLRSDGTLHRFAVAHTDATREQFLGCNLDIDNNQAGCISVKVVRSGSSEFGVCAGDADYASLCVTNESGVAAYATVPIVARGKVLGAVSFCWSDDKRRFNTLDILTAKDLARRAGLALDNAILYETVRRAVRARNEVLGVVSHDLRVPVSVMTTAVTMLKESLSGEQAEARKLFSVLDRATQQMMSLIEDLLDASRLESDQFTVDKAPVKLEKIVADATSMLKLLAASKEIEINATVESGIPPVVADEGKIARVIANLIGNAIKFSPSGSTIYVHAGMRYSEVQVSVRDQGNGIPNDQLVRVFERFWSGQNAHARGAGLGLAIARGIIEAHGGRIWATSRMGGGSTFTFTLPVVPEGNPEPARGSGGRN